MSAFLRKRGREILERMRGITLHYSRRTRSSSPLLSSFLGIVAHCYKKERDPEKVTLLPYSLSPPLTKLINSLAP